MKRARVKLLGSFCGFEGLFFICCSLILITVLEKQLRCSNDVIYDLSFLLWLKSQDIVYEFTFLAVFAVFPSYVESVCFCMSSGCLTIHYSLTFLEQRCATLRLSDSASEFL